MKAIDYAWNENLKLDKDEQYKNKQELIKNNCPVIGCDFYGIDLEEFSKCTDDYDKKICTQCWNREVKDNTITKIPQIVHKEIKEDNNKYLLELHKEFINTYELNMQEALILKKFLDFMTKHE
jgi:hypothetical protein